MRATLGLDLGGTKIAAGVLTDDGLKGYFERPTPQTGDGDAVARAIAEAGREAVRQSGLAVAVAGVGTPGPLDFAEGVVRFAPNIPGLVDYPLRERLEDWLGMRVILENDANAAALAEHHFGAAQGAKHSLYVTVSTGIGGGVIINGRVHRGAYGQGGEVGHLTVVPGGPLCGCGRQGCLEAVASGRALERDASYAYGEPLSAEALFVRFHDGEAKAVSLVEGAARHLGVALASLQKVLDPEVIVLGGGVVLGGGEDFVAAIRRAYEEHLRGWKAAPIRTARLGRSVGVIGAALAAEYC